MERRTMMKWMIRVIGIATAGMVGIPAFIAAFSPSWMYRRRPSVWRSLGRIEDFPVGEMRKIVVSLTEEPWGGALQEKAVYAWRPTEAEAVAFSRSCTDLGCPLTFDDGSECFF